MERIKEEFLKLLDKDVEFRYAVVGYLGLSEIIKGQEKIWENLNKIWENLNRLWENQNKLWEEIRALREDQKKLWENQNKLWENQNKLWENVNKLWEEVRALREGQNKLWENQNRLWEEVKALREGQNKLWEEVKALREDQRKLWENQNRLWEEVKALRETQREMATTLQRLTITVEEEGRSVIRYRLKNELGMDVELDRLFFDNEEIDIYGSTGDLSIVGEATVRLGKGLIEEMERKIENLKKMKLLKQKIIKVIYVDYATPDSLELASKYDIWVLNWQKDLTQRKIISI